MFVYVAAYGGALAAENALTGNERRYDLSALPKVTFTDPAVSSVGLTENEARAQGIEPLVSKLPRSEEHTSELQSRLHLVCRLLLEKKKKKNLSTIKSTQPVTRLT